MIKDWLRTFGSYNMVQPMPTPVTVCDMRWNSIQTIDVQGKAFAKQAGFISSENCSKETAPVRVLGAAHAYVNYQDRGSTLNYSLIIFAVQVYTPEYPMGKLLAVIAEGSTPDGSILPGFAAPERYLAIAFDFADRTLQRTGQLVGAANILTSIGLYNQDSADAAMQAWTEAGYPTDAIDSVDVLVGGPATLNRFIEPTPTPATTPAP
jgi:hypothetical protein